MANLSETDAARAISAARELERALAPALSEYGDGASLTDIQAWKDAGVAAVLRPVKGLIEHTLKRLAQ